MSSARSPIQPIAAITLAAAAITTIAAVDNGQTALLTALAGGAVLATRIRYTAYVAVALVVLTAVLVSAGHAVGDDERPPNTHEARR